MEPWESNSIKQWAEDDRPREKLMSKGRAALSDAELIAILIGSGTRTLSAVELSRQILHSVGNNLNDLAKLSVKDLTKFNGIGEAKAISIVSALELGRRRKSETLTEKPKISCSADAYEMIRGDIADLQHEEFWVILLKRNNEVIKKIRISTGGVTGTVVDSKLIFKGAVEELAPAIILVHNHPSGNLQPSTPDVRLTKQLVEAGKVMDVKVLDHLIVTDRGYYSFNKEGMM